ncbi:FecR domain-containing protein [uncultured Sunxiuqinia sp.]|uniref:FecR family protein n=1 Tax=uncultured Sunxiuqinia sp. TaxID=1573825 RepID=UPI00261BE9EC|nr:FecR domain-containing protein [uncultured Sunxiuqinia sp.]
MTNNTYNKRAEDILTDDRLLNQADGLRPMPGIDEGELSLAKNIQQALKRQKKELDETEQQELQTRLNTSIHQFNRKQRIIQLASVAAVLLMVFFAVTLLDTSRSQFLRFASNFSVEPQLGQTRLILEEGNDLEISATEASIQYSQADNSIQVSSIEQLTTTLLEGEKNLHTLLVPFGKRTKITLSDGSIVWVNSGSKLIYPSRFDDDKREVYLEGAAIFDITHRADQPFYVYTDDLDVRVLGTMFAVSAYPDDENVNTVLERGKVELKYKGTRLIGYEKDIITPGTKATYLPEAGTMTQTQVNTRNYTSWKDGYVFLEKKTLGYIVKKIARYYNVTIHVEDEQLASETFSGMLDLRNNASQILEIISEVINIDIEKDHDQIVIKRKQKW